MKIDKSWYEKPNTPNFPVTTSCGGIVIRKDNKKLLIALLKGQKVEGYFLPKGKSEKNESYEETAIREIKEETGLSNLKLICKLGIKERLRFEKNEWKVIHYFLFETNDVDGLQKLDETEGKMFLKWFDLNKLPPLCWPDQKDLIEVNLDKIQKTLLLTA